MEKKGRNGEKGRNGDQDNIDRIENSRVGWSGMGWTESGMGWQGGKNVRNFGNVKNGLGKNMVYDTTTVDNHQYTQGPKMII